MYSYCPTTLTLKALLAHPFIFTIVITSSCVVLISDTMEGQWPSGRVEASEPGGPGFNSLLGSRRSSLISIEHAELLRSTPLLVLCCAWLVTMALHVHCSLGQLSPLPTSEDDKWVAAKHCERAKRSRISDTHRLRSSLQFHYMNIQSLLLHFTIHSFTSLD